MKPLIDWISFTVPVPTDRDGVTLRWLDPRNPKLCRRQALGWVSEKVGIDVMRTMFPALEKVESVGRFPYKYSVVDDRTSVRCFFDSRLDHILVEVSGRGCSELSQEKRIESLLVCVHNSTTRLDLSADIATDCTPIEFIRAGYNNRFSSNSTHQSDGGQTVYIGSSKSDRQAAVYRYAPPHPRSHLLRVEHRMRRDSAKAYAKFLAENGLTTAVLAAGEVFDWQSPLWDSSEIGDVPMPKVDVSAKDSNVARWLLTQVFPAMRRYEREGTIPDLKAFVQEYLFEDDVD